MKYNKGLSTISVVLIVIAALGIYFLQKNSGIVLKNTDQKQQEQQGKNTPTPNPTTEDKKINDISYTKINSDNPIVIANNKFTFDIYSKITEKGKNVFFSPLSISSAFAMVYEGASGKTADEIQSVFHFPKDMNILRTSFSSINNDVNNASNDYKLSIANALWVQQDFKFLDKYLSAVDQYYVGKATNVDFVNKTEEVRQTINQWVEGKTNNKIKDLLAQGTLSSGTRLVLTNAIYFKGQWEKAFDKKLTSEQNFNVDNNTKVKVQMMKKTDKDAVFKYGENGNLQILDLPYKGNKISMMVLLPKDNNIASLEKSFSFVKLNEWKKLLSEKRVDVFLPKFKIETQYYLADTLSGMGMPTAFTGNADFSGMDGKTDLSITKVIHKAFVDVNEEGTEAAAATAIIVGVTSAGPDFSIPVFRADHPFLFIIQDTTNGNILFIGKIENPTI